ncbi:hypothetical protein AB0F77_19865 [Streptomyces sp. NPDC026672]|uniref:hypothetical protein n=1 Tax=unclassified Streptomyces TaxID=2593676 RepID=UPI0033E485C0
MAAVAIVLVFLLTTLVLGQFGLTDFQSALTFPGRITGAILIAVAATTLLGALAVMDHWFRSSFAYSGLAALISAIAAFVANALLLAKTWSNGDYSAYLAVFGLLTAGSAWAAVVVWRTSVLIPAPKRVATAVIVSSAIAIANFGYQNLYQPSQMGAKPLIKLTVGEPVLSEDRRAFAVPVDIRLENQSGMGFYVLGTEIHAMGERVSLSAKDRLRQQWRTDAEQWKNFEEDNPLSRREIYEPGELVGAQPMMPYGGWLEAHDAFATRVVVQMPMDTPYDQVAFYASASFARKDRLGLESIAFKGYTWGGGKVPQWVKSEESDAIVYRGRVEENNAIDKRTRDARYVTVYWRFGQHGADVSAVIARDGEEGTKTESVSRYGIINADTGPVELTLWDVKSRR